MMKCHRLAGLSLLALAMAGCSGENAKEVDLVIRGNQIITGAEDSDTPQKGVLVVDDGIILYAGAELPDEYDPQREVDAGDDIVAPGFIDAHTHACDDFGADNSNLNYLTQGVTTVFCGNDGGGPTAIEDTLAGYEQTGLGSNVALFVGHGTVRRAVMGEEDRAPTPDELIRMEKLVSDGMKEGALGLSTGLYYAPGAFAKTDEVIALSRVAAAYGGVYDSHIRDEASYGDGLIASIEEVIDIGKGADIPVHIAHIKALGTDVWGKSADIVAMVEKARQQGVDITADQYPWKASGTSVGGALSPRWVLAGGEEEYHARLRDPAQLPRIKREMTDNLRRRGGAASLLITDPKRPELRGKTLADIAKERGTPPVETAINIILTGNARVASFNMDEADMERFAQQPWVMTSSDGSTGHPRKFATFPKKYRDWVARKPVLTLGEFVHRSSGLTAQWFGLTDRGTLEQGKAADIVIFNPETYAPQATYLEPKKLSTGVDWLVVNGRLAIDEGEPADLKAGQGLRKSVRGENDGEVPS
ncbi:hypothetical protein D6851_14200 [Altericroceibacterium spongiae]|uniref:Amidohydrolase 3 domain-containing protein n=1 Tax=Altericroceibacterium spongiae TaxID=2320269 RepID=A0A420EE41_9SPHN|nr:amidohydrolase family protein [Altericroceibacterium spongiae]RKF18943.1 hypothetical protein D6851_14200 [Altericroceibacterium spongiae]